MSRALHVEILRALHLEASKRKRAHEEKCGKGLEDREYQRHVGRIAECSAQIEVIETYLKRDVDELEDESERLQDREQKDRATRRQR